MANVDPGLPIVHLLDADPGLAHGLDAETARTARVHLKAAVLQLDSGPWVVPPALAERRPQDLGLLVLEGLLLRDVALADESCTELLGKGDLVRPWDGEEGDRSVPTRVEWFLLQDTTLAVLDERFASAAASWRIVMSTLLSRAVRRAQALAVHFAITCLTGVALRLHLLFWFWADRWGKVGPDGVVLPLRLTHASLAKLVRARRPAVTLGLRELRERDLVVPQPDRSWLLRGGPPALPMAPAAAQDPHRT